MTSDSFSVDITPPSINSITTNHLSWGSVLNAANANLDGTVDISTSDVEDGQDVSVTLNGVTYTGSSTSNSATIPIPSSDLQSLADGNSYINSRCRDAAGNPASTVTSASFSVDKTNPTISSIISLSPDGYYGVGDEIELKIEFGENVTLDQGVLNITLETGDNDRIVSINNTEINNTNSLNVIYTVQAGHSSSSLESKEVNLSTGILSDDAGNQMSNFSIPTNISSTKQIVVDTTPPTLDITATVGATQIQPGSTTNDTSIDLIFSLRRSYRLCGY